MLIVLPSLLRDGTFSEPKLRVRTSESAAESGLRLAGTSALLVLNICVAVVSVVVAVWFATWTWGS